MESEVRGKPVNYQERPQRHIWIVWVLLGLLLCMAAGYWTMETTGEPAAQTAPSSTPVPTPTPPPTPMIESTWEEPEAEKSAETLETSVLEEPSSLEEVPEEEPPQETPELVEETEPVEISDTPPWYLRLVNRDHPIPEEYEIELAEVPGGQLVDARIYDSLMALLAAAEAEELGPIVVAGYRTWEKQQSIMDERVRGYLNQGYSEADAKAAAEQWVSVPGCSEHQLGLAVDINGAVSAIYPWLQEHGWEYGFIQRYPAGKEDITGCREEEWHYRYVGVDAAWEMWSSGLCLEEYFAAGNE